MLEYTIHNKTASNDYVVLLHGLGGNSNIFYKQITYYKRYFNVVTIHLPGHGNSPAVHDYADFSFSTVAREIIKTLEHLKINSAHFVSISLGSVILHYILKEKPELVQKAVLAGTITRFNQFSKRLYTLGKCIKSVTPYAWLYALFAYIIMPKSNHKKSRKAFIKEAKKLKRNDFLGWFHMVDRLEESYLDVPAKSEGVPKLYVSGSEDHLFIDSVKQDISQDKDAQMQVIEKCGHVCNLEKHRQFNKITTEFLQSQPKAVREIS